MRRVVILPITAMSIAVVLLLLLLPPPPSFSVSSLGARASQRSCTKQKPRKNNLVNSAWLVLVASRFLTGLSRVDILLSALMIGKTFLLLAREREMPGNSKKRRPEIGYLLRSQV